MIMEAVPMNMLPKTWATPVRLARGVRSRGLLAARGLAFQKRWSGVSPGRWQPGRQHRPRLGS